MTAPVPVPDGTTPPAEAVILTAIERQLRAVHYNPHPPAPDDRQCDCSACTDGIPAPDMAWHLAAAVVAALRLPERDRETEVKVRGEAMTQERLGGNIRRAIQAAGMTQKEVAERAEIDPTALSKIVTGKRRVSSLELALICTATGSDVFGLLEAEPIHGPSYRAGLEEGAHWAALREGRES